MRDFIVANSTYQFFFGRILEVSNSQLGNLYKIQYSDNMIQNINWSELHEWLLPASFDPNRIKEIESSWKKTFQAYSLIHSKLSESNGANWCTPAVFVDDYDFIKHIFRFSLAGRSEAQVCSHACLQAKCKLLSKSLSAARTKGLDSKYRVACSAVLSMAEYLTSLRLHMNEASAPIPSMPTLDQYPAFGSEAFFSLPAIENPLLLLEPPSTIGLDPPAPGLADPEDDDFVDSTPYLPHTEGHDMPLDAPNPSLLASDGSLPNHWKAVDAFHLNDSLLSVFHHHLYVPGDCVKPWALCLQKAAKTLDDTLNSPPEGLSLRLRRAVFWYAALPQILLRDVRGKTRLRKSSEISERCGLFLMGRYSQLLQSWRSDRAKLLSKGKRSERPDTELRRLEQAVKKIQRNEPHCISKAVNLVLGHGRATCDNPETLEQMRSKHPEGRGTWDKLPTPVSREEKSWHRFDSFSSIVKRIR